MLFAGLLSCVTDAKSAKDIVGCFFGEVSGSGLTTLLRFLERPLLEAFSSDLFVKIKSGCLGVSC